MNNCNMYNIWKMLYAAEKYSLNKYGCPITGDNYFAMKHGTVPSKLYNMAKISQAGMGFYRFDNFLVAEREAEEGYLSDANMEALEFGYKEYAGLTFDEVEKKNHEEAAWKKNYISDTSAFIPFEDIIEEDWVKEDLEGVAHRMVL
ncbi:MAG: Panacea domain-containing protein [Fibromonadales bacterium]|nr:Panacea domain-containing protein [Fibromonadales bacterium]